MAFNAVVLRLTSEHGEWTRNQVKRPKKAVIGLGHRALQNCGLLEHNVVSFGHAEGRILIQLSRKLCSHRITEKTARIQNR